ncbi:hypothetical protein DR996_07235 [Vibrio owensii]|nr:hypothetical protein DR996_07235 [Vibrio owensii]
MISVAIVTWNRLDKLKRCLDSCVEHGELINEIIVVDNCSDDGTSDAFSTINSYKGISFNYLRMHENLGCPVARNIAMANCKSDFIYCLDDDGWLQANTLRTALDIMLSDSKVAVVCSKIMDPDTKFILGHSGKKRNLGNFSAGASLYRTSVIDRVGYFPSYFRQMEESHLSLRIIDNKYKILFQPESIMYHEKQKTNIQSTSEVRLNYIHDANNMYDLLSIIYYYPVVLLKSRSHLKIYKDEKALKYFVLDFFKVIFPMFSFERKRYKNVSLDSFLRQKKLNRN